MRRTKVRRVLIIVAIAIAALVGGFVLVIYLTAPRDEPTSRSVAQKDIPADWITGEEALTPPQTAAASRFETPVQPTQSQSLPQVVEEVAGPAAWNTEGSLTYVSDGRPFGEEEYEISIGPNQVALRSSGSFRFKVVVATIRITFDQSLKGDFGMAPTAYHLQIDAPLGMDQEITGDRSSNRFTVVRNGKSSEIEIDPASTVVLGTFSTYALLPALLAQDASTPRKDFRVLMFGGPPGAGGDADDGGLPLLSIERWGGTSIRTASGKIAVDRYRVLSDFGESTLLAKGKDFLALLSEGEEGTLRVYRTDFFPDGFELVDEPDASS